MELSLTQDVEMGAAMEPAACLLGRANGKVAGECVCSDSLSSTAQCDKWLNKLTWHKKKLSLSLVLTGSSVSIEPSEFVSG